MSEDQLAKYIIDDLFKWMADERQAQLEPQWRRNFDAFMGKYNSDVLKKWKATEGNDWRSKVFCRLTKQKVLTGYNQVTSVAFQKGKIPWDIAPTPVSKTKAGIYLPEDVARQRADNMRLQIADDLAVTKAEKQFQASVLEKAVYGLSFVRGPFMEEQSSFDVDFGIPDAGSMYFSPDMVQKYGRHNMKLVKKQYPVFQHESVWNVFWDLESPDYQKGHGIFILEPMSKGRFEDLKDKDGFDGQAIDEIQQQYTGKEDGSDQEEKLGPLRERYQKRKRVIPVYMFWGRVPKDKLKKANPELTDKVNSREVEIFCVCAGGVKGARIIRKPVINPLPYRQVFKSEWQKIPGFSGGIGIPEDVEDSQMVINGLTRAMLDNKALSSNLLSVWNPRKLAPGQSKTVYPGKSFEVDESVENVREAFNYFSPPDVTGQTPELIETFRKWADEESGLNRMMDGSPAGGKRSAFEMSRIAEAGTKMIGGVIKNMDEGQIEPLIKAYYHYHMLCNPNEELKGDCEVVAKGYQSYQDKTVRNQDLLSLLTFTLSSEITGRYAKVREWLGEIASTRDLDPDRFYFTEDEVQQKMQQELEAQLQNKLPGGGGNADELG